MKHLGALLVKFIIVAVVLEIVLLSVTALSFTNILVVSLTITLLAYLVGDLAILPKSNNTAATIADMGLSLIVILLFNYVYPGAGISFFDALFASVVLGIGEWVYHKFIAKSVLPDHQS